MKTSLILSFCLFIAIYGTYAKAEPSPAGVWQVSGKDEAGDRWKAKLVLRPVGDDYPPTKFKGYFDWVGTNGMKGREFIVEGLFDYETRILKLSGSELENAHPRLKTSLYTIEMNEEASRLENGSWRSCGVVPGVWNASRTMEVASDQEPARKGKIRVDVAKEGCGSPEKCNGPQCEVSSR